MQKTAWNRPRRRGGVMVLMVAALGVMLGVGAYVVDMSSALASRTHQQAAADAGALAAAYRLAGPNKDENAAKAAAVDYVQRNGFAITTNDVTIWNYNATTKAVTVGWSQPVPTTFARVFGVNTMPVRVRSAATVGNVSQVPPGSLPFGVPAEVLGNGQWKVMAKAPNDYQTLSTSPATTIQLKVGSKNSNSGNFLALALGSNGGNTYRDNIVYGAKNAIAYGSKVNTETGNLVGPTTQGLDDRLARGPEFKYAYVPMIKRSEWESNNGKSEVTVIGFVMVELKVQGNKGEVFATFINKVIPATPSLTTANSPGAYTPILIPPPGT